MIWTVLWLLFISDFPRQHTRLSKAERRYIHATLLQETIQTPRTVGHIMATTAIFSSK